jgi:hypothetical protein
MEASDKAIQTVASEIREASEIKAVLEIKVVSVIRELRRDQIITTNLPHQEGTTVDTEMTADSEITTTITRTAEVASDQEAVASVEETAVAADSDPAVAAEEVSEVVDNFNSN